MAEIRVAGPPAKAKGVGGLWGSTSPMVKTAVLIGVPVVAFLALLRRGGGGGGGGSGGLGPDGFGGGGGIAPGQIADAFNSLEEQIWQLQQEYRPENTPAPTTGPPATIPGGGTGVQVPPSGGAGQPPTAGPSPRFAGPDFLTFANKAANRFFYVQRSTGDYYDSFGNRLPGSPGGEGWRPYGESIDAFRRFSNPTGTRFYFLETDTGYHYDAFGNRIAGAPEDDTWMDVTVPRVAEVPGTRQIQSIGAPMIVDLPRVVSPPTQVPNKGAKLPHGIPGVIVYPSNPSPVPVSSEPIATRMPARPSPDAAIVGRALKRYTADQLRSTVADRVPHGAGTTYGSVHEWQHRRDPDAMAKGIQRREARQAIEQMRQAAMARLRGVG